MSGPFELPHPDPLQTLRTWVRLWKGHNGRLMPDVDMPTIEDAANELERLRRIERRVRRIADSQRDLGDWPVLARHLLGEA